MLLCSLLRLLWQQNNTEHIKADRIDAPQLLSLAVYMDPQAQLQIYSLIS